MAASVEPVSNKEPEKVPETNDSTEADIDAAEPVLEEPTYATLSLLDQLLCQYLTPTGEHKYCMATDNKDGTYMLDIDASETGMYKVDVEMSGKRIPRAPFSVRIIQRTDSKKVTMYGKGLRSGVLGNFESTIHVDTKGAGPGKLNVKIHGPKEGFKVALQREDERLVCINYEPNIVGVYTVNVLWSGEHIAGSPCEVNVTAA